MISIRLSLVGAQVDCRMNDVAAADVLEELDHDLAVGEAPDGAAPEADVEVLADGLRELGIRVAGENAHALEGHGVSVPLYA